MALPWPEPQPDAEVPGAGRADGGPRGGRPEPAIEAFWFDRADAVRLARWLSAQSWSFHPDGTPSTQQVLDRVAAGHFDGPGIRTFWLVENARRVGLVRLDGVGAGTPQFDLRIAATDRGRGLGTLAVRWLTGYVFADQPGLQRIEAVTRKDDVVMRAVLRRCGYAKEAHRRKAWPAPDGSLHDAVGYAVLRLDWATGTVTRPVFDDDPADR